MIRWAYNYFAEIPSIFIDGLVYVLLSIVSAWMGILSSESARNFIGPVALFWVSAFLVTANSGLLAIKMFRSTAFADHQQNKKDALHASQALQQVASLLQTTTTNKDKQV